MGMETGGRLARWSVELVAATLRISAPSAGQALEDLGLGNLLDVRVGEALAYRFAPVNSTVAHYHRDRR
jgi:hypothetical protein